jgi:hypothetical protein
MLCILRICIQHVNTRLGSTDATERMGTDAGDHAVLLLSGAVGRSDTAGANQICEVFVMNGIISRSSRWC